jgi:putative peptidoglycan lipid II flippase
MIGIDRSWGVAGLTASAGIAGWVEFLLLRWRLHRRIGSIQTMSAFLAKLWCSAVISAGLGWAIKLAVRHRHPIIVAIAVLIPYGVAYFGLTSILGIPEARTVLGRVRRLTR